MNIRHMRLIAMLLACVLAIGALPVYAIDFELPEDSLEEVPGSIIYASYSSNITDDDTISAIEGWLMNEPMGSNTIDVQWDSTNLYFAVNKTNRELSEVTFAVTINGQTASVEYSFLANGVKEVSLAFNDIGVTVSDYSKQIPATISLGSTTWEGVIVLTSTKWEHTKDSNKPTVWVGQPTYTHGGVNISSLRYSTESDNSLRLYDLYSSTASENYGGARIHANWNNLNAFNYCEFDMQIDSLPVYKLGLSSTVDYKYAVFGINWWMARSDGYGISMGIINTEDGLVFVLRSDGPDQFVRLNREVGETLHLASRWESDDSVTLFMDGVKLANLKNAKMYLKVVSNYLGFISHRSDDPAKSAADNIDVTIHNIAVGNSYGEHLLDNLTFDDFKGENQTQNTVSSNLSLPATMTDGQLSGNVTWSSSDESVINSQTGVVTRPATNSRTVVLTATCGSVTKKFTLMVLGRNPDGQVMFVENDLKTATGAGSVTADSPSFTLDRYNSSIIYNQGSKQKVNVIELVDSDDVNRLNESVLTIWYSNDNKTYTQLDDYFKILRKGNKTYLYDFEIEAQYIKVHCTHYEIHEADFTNVLRDMINVHYIEMPFNTTSQVIIENDTNKAVYDQPYSVTLENAGALCLKTDYSDVRFYLDGELLYHYYDGERFVVRVPYIAAYGVVKLTVQSGNVNAADISNKEYVYEVVYGTRESCDESYKAYSADAKGNDKIVPQNELPKYLVSLPDNVMWGFRAYSYTIQDDEGVVTSDYKGFYYKTSYDGGVSWSNNYLANSETTVVTAADDFINDIRGAFYDEDSGRLIVVGRFPVTYTDEETGEEYTESYIRFMYTENLTPGNKTDWVKCPELTYADGTKPFDDQTFSLDTYSKPVKVSSYDGAGSNVDFVLPVCVGKDENGNGMISAMYSTDCGESWILSYYQIYTDPGVIAHNAENGLTEANLLEDDNGRLVILCRYQYGDTVNFATIYSYDFGISWTTEDQQGTAANGLTRVKAKASSVYSGNTQPCMIELGGNNLLFWGGNNVLGGSAYMRYPFNVAVSYDNMDTFENIQDMFSRYSMQGLTMGDRMSVTNQSVDSSIEDRVAMIWYDDKGDQSLVIDNFTDYFYRTKGAYDSFENTSTKYEGWSSVYGNASVSQACSTDGRYSMMIPGGVSVVRSIPYLQNGKIAFDLYLANVNNASAQFELESAYGTEYGKAAPIAFAIRNGKLYFLNADHSGEVQVAATLKTGWNHFEFDLELLAQTPSATLSVNSGEAVELPVDLAIGDYICYVDITTSHGMDYYLDSFLVQDMDVTRVPDETSGPKVYGNSILLGKNFAVNYYVQKALFESGAYKDPYMIFELNGEETKVTTYKESGDYYIFTFTNLAPNQMTEHIYATLHATVADGSAYASDTTFYSVARYAYNQLANDNTSAQLRTLLVDLLNYGTAAQLYKGETDNLANSKLTEEQKAWGSDAYDELSSVDITSDETDNAVKMNSGSLVLGDSVVIRVYFTASDISNLTIKVEGAEKVWTIGASAFQKDGDRYYADFGGLNPAQMREVISFTAYNGDTAVSRTMQYSIETYAYRMLNHSEELKLLLESMIKYGDATKAYTDSLAAN